MLFNLFSDIRKKYEVKNWQINHTMSEMCRESVESDSIPHWNIASSYKSAVHILFGYIAFLYSLVRIPQKKGILHSYGSLYINADRW